MVLLAAKEAVHFARYVGIQRVSIISTRRTGSVSVHEATVAQGGGEVGEVGAEEGIEPSPESMEE